ncbi:MAG: hypothetical protein CVU62_10550 [Deltaproteobacteria bacterium HGW-Deltaproteobacteria-2]|nr:MAG: hypothetical protein CVU62_10550 [Deltaproteobacteria bacterium HGW-Deltaproteobacteria-2]
MILLLLCVKINVKISFPRRIVYYNITIYYFLKRKIFKLIDCRLKEGLLIDQAIFTLILI